MSTNEERSTWSTEVRSRVVVALIISWSVTVFVYARWVHPVRPGVVTPEGWYGWWDQSQYLKLAQILSEWRLPATAGDYQYGLGYPALAVPFNLMGFEGDPFAPVDLLLFCAVILGSYFLGRNLRNPRFGLVLALIMSVATPVLGLMVVPWNTSVGITGLVVILAIATSVKPISWQRAVAIGVLVGLTFAARYVDGVVLAVVVALVVVFRKRGDSIRLAVASALSTLLIVSVVLLTHSLVLGGPLTTPYATHTREDLGSDQSFANYSLSWVPEHAAQSFITARADDGSREPASPLLLRFLMLGLAPVGVAVVGVAGYRRHDSVGSNSWFLISVGVVSLVSSLFYLSFVAGGGVDVKFHNARYWQMWFPYWGFLALETVWSLADWVQTSTLRDGNDDS